MILQIQISIQIDFGREYNYSYFLSPHPNILDTFEGSFSTPDVWFFAQEFSPCSSLREAVQSSRYYLEFIQICQCHFAFHYSSGMSEKAVKNMLAQVVAALQFMHNEDLVHRNVQVKSDESR